jgi:hypothetical protein
MAAPNICSYCRQPIALQRDNYVLLPSEHPAGGDWQPAHLECAAARRREVDALPSAGEGEPTRDSFEVLYLTKRAAYHFALVVPRAVPSAVRRGLAFFRFWLPGEAPQDGVVPTLPVLTAFYEDLGRLLEYLRRERHARSPSYPPPSEGEAHP